MISRGNIVPGVARTLGESATRMRLSGYAMTPSGVMVEPVTAHDFVFAWRNALKPQTASEYAFILYPLLNGEAINKGEMDPARPRRRGY